MPADRSRIARIAERVATARRVLWITGAGVSADSGLPTYRGVGGLYNSGTTEEGMPIEELLSGPTFARRPDLTWKYIAEIERACRGREPNRAHEVIAWSEARFESCVLTQNVDGFHRRAGSQNVIDIHGDLLDLYCTECEWRDRPPDFSALDIPPACPACGGVVRPDAVLFGEMLPAAKVERLNDELRRGFDAVFSIGTTSVFPYIAQPVLRARAQKALTVEINPSRSEVSDLVEFQLSSGAAETLDILWEHIERAG